MSFLLFTKYNNVYPPLGCTHHTPYFIYTPIKLASFENIINFALKNSNLALHGIYILCKIKYPIASGGLRPPDPLLQRYNFRISPSPQKILDPPLVLCTTMKVFPLESFAVYGTCLQPAALVLASSLGYKGYSYVYRAKIFGNINFGNHQFFPKFLEFFLQKFLATGTFRLLPLKFIPLPTIKLDSKIVEDNMQPRVQTNSHLHLS